MVETWQRAHPDGQVILRGHSDGTYAGGYIFDYLKSKGRPPQVVVPESPRQAHRDWAKRAQTTPETLFLSITSTTDLPRETIFDTGYARVPSRNWVNLHVQGGRNPFVAHGLVTKYREPNLKIQRSDVTGQTFTTGVTLGELVKREVTGFIFPHSQTAPSGTPGGTWGQVEVNSDAVQTQKGH